MQIELTAEQRALQTELREYFGAIMTPEVEAEVLLHGASFGSSPTHRAIGRKLGADGWLGLGWPKEYGGQDRSPIEQAIFMDEALSFGVPFPGMSVMAVGPAIIRFGTPEQKERYLPAILRGELYFAAGYSEPNAGTDLASLTTRAVRDGDEYVINGQKMWTSMADHADYIWLAARTDPEAKRHRGISMIVVPTSTPGFSVVPVYTLSDRTNATFYDDVRVPVDNLVGEENQGWNVIMEQLNHERSGIGHAGTVHRYLREVRHWAQETKISDGRRVIDQEWVQVNLAKVAAKAEYLQLRNWNMAWSQSIGDIDPVAASVAKVFSSEFYLEAYGLLMEIVGQSASLQTGTPGAVLGGTLERLYKEPLMMTFGGGTNEIQRDLIGMIGLGLPRAERR